MQVPKKRVAVVLNMEANGLGVARSLGQLGIPVIGMDFVPRPVGFRSKYVKGVRCPDPTTRPSELLDLMMTEGERLGEKGVLYTSTDAFATFVSRNRRDLSKWYELTLPPEEVIEGLVNKRYQYQWAEKLGIPMTQTFFPKDIGEAREIKNELRYPAFIKGQTSHLWAREFGNKGFIARGPEELERGLARAFGAGLEVVVQKIIMPPGENFVAMAAYLGRNGYCSPTISWLKVRQTPPNFGVGSFLVSKAFPELEETGLRFMKGIGFVGPGAIGFKRDPDDGLWKLIEMNGRYWSQNYFATRCGYNLPLLQYLDSLGEPMPQLGAFEEGVRWWDPMSDFDTFVRLRRQGRIGAGEWIRSWFPSHVYPYYQRGDLGPALAQADYGLAWAKELGGLLKMKVDEDAAWDKHESN